MKTSLKGVAAVLVAVMATPILAEDLSRPLASPVESLGAICQRHAVSAVNLQVASAADSDQGSALDDLTADLKEQLPQAIARERVACDGATINPQTDPNGDVAELVAEVRVKSRSRSVRLLLTSGGKKLWTRNVTLPKASQTARNAKTSAPAASSASSDTPSASQSQGQTLSEAEVVAGINAAALLPPSAASGVSAAQAEEPPPLGPPVSTEAVTSLGKKVLSVALGKLSKFVGDGSSKSFIEEVLDEAGGAYRNGQYGTPIDLRNDELRPGDILFLGYAKGFTGRSFIVDWQCKRPYVMVVYTVFTTSKGVRGIELVGVQDGFDNTCPKARLVRIQGHLYDWATWAAVSAWRPFPRPVSANSDGEPNSEIQSNTGTSNGLSEFGTAAASE